MKPLAAALLLVALVGAGWAESHGVVYWCKRCQKWYQQHEGMWAYGCGVVHQPGDCCHHGEAEVAVSLPPKTGMGTFTDMAVPGGACGMTDWYGPLTPEPAPVFESSCAQGVHDWQQVYRVQAYVKALYPPESKDGYPAYVDLQACSRCGLLRVKPVETVPADQGYHLPVKP